MSIIKGIHHVALKAHGMENFNKALDFYQNVLGMKKIRSWGKGEDIIVMLDTGAGILELFSNAPNVLPTGVFQHLAFETDQPDTCIDAVKRAGYQVTTEPTDVIIQSETPYPVRIAFCIGPVSETIEFFKVR